MQKDWLFTVDTSVPKLKLNGSAEEGRINTSPAVFSGSTEAHATVAVTDGSVTASAVAGADGKYSVTAQLPDGPSKVTVTATDRAGNSTAKKLDVHVDAVPPVLTVSQIPKKKGNAKIRLRIKTSDQLGPPRLTVVLDGEELREKKQASSMDFKADDLAQGKTRRDRQRQ